MKTSNLSISALLVELVRILSLIKKLNSTLNQLPRYMNMHNAATWNLSVGLNSHPLAHLAVSCIQEFLLDQKRRKKEQKKNKSKYTHIYIPRQGLDT